MMSKNIRRAFSYLAMAAVAVGFGSGLLSSCKDNDDDYKKPEVTITPAPADNMIKFSADGGEQKFTIEGNRPWSVQSNASWLAIDPTNGGTGKHTITVKALANTTAARSTQISLIAGRTKVSYTVSQEGKPGTPDVGTHTTLAQFLAKHKDKTPVESITEDDVLEVTVLSDLEKKNEIISGLIHVQEGDAGLVVLLPKGGVNPKVGEVIRIKVKGARLGQYINKDKKPTGKIQLTKLTKEMVETTGRIAPITPKTVTLDEIFEGKYDNLLVAIEDLQFVKTEGTLYTGSGSAYHQRVTDCKDRPGIKNSLSVTIFKNATFGTEKIPTMRGRMVGILDLTRDDKTDQVKYYNLIIRSLEDLDLKKDRCQDGSKPKPEPPTPTPPVTGDAKLIISAYVEGRGNEKYIQIYNPTGETVQLSDYEIIMSNFSGKGNRVGDKPTKLTGEIASKGVVTISHKEAKLFTAATKDTGAAINFNGNDNVGLFFKGKLTDLIGAEFYTEWKIDGKDGGADIVLQRKKNVNKPSPVFGKGEQWVQTPYDEFIKKDPHLSFLGKVPEVN